MSQKRRSVGDEVHFLVRTAVAELKAATTIRRHAHEWHQLIYIAAGLMRVDTEVGSWVTPSSWAIWVPAGTRHAIRFVHDSAFRTAYVRPEWSETAPRRCTVIAVSPLLREIILRTSEIGTLDRRSTVQTALATLLVSELRQSEARSLSLQLPTSKLMCRAAALMVSDASEGATVRSLARAVGVGTRTLERRFFAETGLSPGRWRQQQAMLAGLEQLALGSPIKAAAERAGYATAGAFIVAFCQTFGTTPGRYFANTS
jgi:AraC-like DNA-binding protein